MAFLNYGERRTHCTSVGRLSVPERWRLRSGSRWLSGPWPHSKQHLLGTLRAATFRKASPQLSVTWGICDFPSQRICAVWDVGRRGLVPRPDAWGRASYCLAPSFCAPPLRSRSRSWGAAPHPARGQAPLDPGRGPPLGTAPTSFPGSVRRRVGAVGTSGPAGRGSRPPVS